MPGMKITLSAAMRARDVSMPGPADVAEAESADQGSDRQRVTAKPDAAPAKRRGPPSRSTPPAPPPAEPAQEASAPDDGPRDDTKRTRRRRSRTRRRR